MTATRQAPVRLADPAAIAAALRQILEPGQVTELRALDAELAGDRRRYKTVSGYFDDVDLLAKNATTIKSAKGVYFIPNKIKAELLARAVNRLRPAEGKPLTADHDIDRRLWLLLDCDAKRPADISADQPQHQAAHDLALAIRDIMAGEFGWPDPIYADSGNGAHLMYRIDLPADDGGLVQRCLEALDAKFSTETVKVDTSVFNPARIWKLYGTRACKGDSTSDRPHRMSKILDMPTFEPIVGHKLVKALTVVPVDLLELLAKTVPVVETAQGQQTYKGNGAPFDLADWIARHVPEAKEPRPWKGSGRRWVLEVCPWNSDHTDDAAFICQQPNGAIVAGCQHDGCKGRGWRDLRDLREPNRGERHHSNGQAKGKTKVEPDPECIVNLLNTELPEPRWVIPNIIPEGVTLLVGSPKIGKSWFTLALSISVALGGRALGKIPVQAGSVLGLFMEDNKRRLKSRLEKLLLMCDGMKPGLLDYAITWKRTDAGGLERLEAWLKAHPDARLVIVDTLARIRADRRHGGNSYDEDYAALVGLKALADEYGVAIVVVHHDTKADSPDPVRRVSGTHGLTGAADTILIISRMRGKADATLFVTGRDVEEQELALVFDQQMGLWTIAGDAERFRLSAERQAIIDVLTQAGERLAPKDVADRLGKNRDAIRQLLGKMFQNGQVHSEDGLYTPVTPVTGSQYAVTDDPPVTAVTTVTGGEIKTRPLPNGKGEEWILS